MLVQTQGIRTGPVGPFFNENKRGFDVRRNVHRGKKGTTSTAFNRLPDDKILDRSKLKLSSDNNFELDPNSRKFSQLVENTVDKGEIESNFSFSHSVFKRLVSKGRQKVSLCGNGLDLYHTISRLLKTLRERERAKMYT